MAERKTATLKEQAYGSIREAILSRKIRRDTIYSEQWFADNFHVSRTPVREALLQLRSEGLIDVLPNRGMIIRNLTVQDARHLFQMRGAIEGYCSSRLARESREPEAVAVLDRIEAAMARCRDNFNMDDELAIHTLTIDYSQNPLFKDEFRRMRAQIEVFWWDVIAVTNRGEEAYREHEQIYECMRAGDVNGAYNASIRHSQVTLQRIREQANFEAPSELRPVDHFLEI